MRCNEHVLLLRFRNIVRHLDSDDQLAVFAILLRALIDLYPLLFRARVIGPAVLSEVYHDFPAGGVLNSKLLARTFNADAGVDDLRDQLISLLVGWLGLLRSEALLLIHIPY